MSNFKTSEFDFRYWFKSVIEAKHKEIEGGNISKYMKESKSKSTESK